MGRLGERECELRSMTSTNIFSSNESLGLEIQSMEVVKNSPTKLFNTVCNFQFRFPTFFSTVTIVVIQSQPFFFLFTLLPFLIVNFLIFSQLISFFAHLYAIGSLSHHNYYVIHLINKADYRRNCNEVVNIIVVACACACACACAVG